MKRERLSAYPKAQPVVREPVPGAAVGTPIPGGQLGDALAASMQEMAGDYGLFAMITGFQRAGIDLAPHADRLMGVLVEQYPGTRKDARARTILAAKALPSGPWQDRFAALTLPKAAKTSEPFVASHLLAWAGTHRSADAVVTLIRDLPQAAISDWQRTQLFNPYHPSKWLCGAVEPRPADDRAAISAALMARDRANPHGQIVEAAARLGSVDPVVVAQIPAWIEEGCTDAAPDDQEAPTEIRSVCLWFRHTLDTRVRDQQVHHLVGLMTHANPGIQSLATETLAACGQQAGTR